MPNKPPHPPYSDTYVLPKTKYGIPVTPEMFENNSFNTPSSEEPVDHKSRWWEKVWAEEEAKQQRLREERAKRGQADEIDRSQRYHPTTAEELEAYRMWQRESEEMGREQAKHRRFRQAAREAEELMEAPKKDIGGKIIVKMDGREGPLRKEITPWDFHGEDEEDENQTQGEIGVDAQGNKLRKWFKKILP